MKTLSTTLHAASVQALTGPESYDFDLVVANAKSMGWLSPEQQLSAVRRESSIVVRTVDTGTANERAYEDGHRWLYQLLHELSQGVWKAKRSCSPGDAISQSGERR